MTEAAPLPMTAGGPTEKPLKRFSKASQKEGFGFRV